MTRNAFFKLATTGVVAAIGLGVPSAVVMANGGDAPRENPARAARAADQASEALERGRISRAITFAENAVAMAPRDASYRSLLGQTYLAAGRFASAEQSFDAATALGAVDSRTLIGHALSLIATDRADSALALLDANAATLPASDYGLALALAGQPQRGALILTDVVRAGGATSRDRQNLALAFALSSRWLEARLIAGQDLPAGQVAERMTQWATLVQADRPAVRIAGLLGTELVNDEGMPVRLALNAAPASAPALAMTDDPAPLAMYAPPAPQDTAELVAAAMGDAPADEPVADFAAVDLPPSDVAPVAVAAAAPADASPVASAPVAVTTTVNGITYVSNPVIQPLRSMVAMVAPLANAAPVAAPAAASDAAPAPVRPFRVAGANVPPRPVATPAAAPAPAATPAPRAAAPTGPVRTTGWSVQLGAFENLAVSQERWASISRRHAAILASRDGISTSATVNGRTVYRLSATGFDSRASATTACNAVRRAGGDCFVRQLPAGENVRWASRQPTTRVASR